jgi:hypothetical protein
MGGEPAPELPRSFKITSGDEKKTEKSDVDGRNAHERDAQDVGIVGIRNV